MSFFRNTDEHLAYLKKHAEDLAKKQAEKVVEEPATEVEVKSSEKTTKKKK